MKNIDVEIYVSQLISFFETNPNDLIKLIGESVKEKFFDKIRKQCYKNAEDGDEISLTQKQILDICVVLNGKDPNSPKKEKLESFIMETKFGNIILN